MNITITSCSFGIAIVIIWSQLYVPDPNEEIQKLKKAKNTFRSSTVEASAQKPAEPPQDASSNAQLVATSVVTVRTPELTH
eukprot:4885674-Amphidinium_carterae.1